MGRRAVGAVAGAAVLVLAACDSSVRFGGTGTDRADRIEIPVDPDTPVDVGAGDFTIEWWMRATTAENPTGTLACGAGTYGWITGHTVVDRDRWPTSGPDGRDFGVAVSSAGELGFGVQTATGAAHTVCTTLPGEGVLDGEWHHVAVQRSSAGTLEIWVDGVRRAQAAGPAGDISYPHGVAGARATDPFLVFGAEKHDAGPGFPSYAGLLDEIRVSDVLRHVADGPRPTGPFAADPDTVGLYHLNETGALPAGGTGVVRDRSGHPDGPTDGAYRATDDGSLPALGQSSTPFAP